MSWSVATKLGWDAAQAANKAFDHLHNTEVEQADYRRLAALGLRGVTISPEAEAEVAARTSAAKQEFRTVLRAAGLFISKETDPFVTDSEVKTSDAIDPEHERALAQEIVSQDVVFWGEADGLLTPIIDRGAFKNLAVAITINEKSDLIASRVYTCLDRYYGTTKVKVSGRPEERQGLSLIRLEYMATTMSEDYPTVENMGEKSNALLQEIAGFLSRNEEAFFAKP